MDIKDFPNPKLNSPKEIRDSKEDSTIASFKAVDNYLKSVGKYIYTDIDLAFERSDPRHIHAWIQRMVSAIVLRSLYIRNAFVESFNARNTVGIFLPLKAWFETVGALASILDLLESNLSPDDLYEKLHPYALGNRGKGSQRIGVTEAINVVTMMEKADKYLKKMKEASSTHQNNKDGDQFFTNFYDNASNPSHPSFDAYEVVGGLSDNGTWQAKSPDEIKGEIVRMLPYYGGLLLSSVFVEHICQKIYTIEKEHFAKLNSQKYFDETDKEIKKEVGGMNLPDGFAIGPMIFSKDGKTADAIIGPAIIAFDYGIANSLNRLSKTSLPVDEFQSAFNSQVEDLVAEMLIYFQNRLKVITKTNVGQFNSIDKCIKEYDRQSIDLSKLCDTNFLLELDKVRGHKHHSDRRYDSDYSITGTSYNTVEKLRELNRMVHKEIHAVNNSLALTHKDYEVKVSKTPGSVSVEFTANNHAFDFTRGAKAVPTKTENSKK